MAREQCTELDIGFSVLETMVAMLEQVLTQEEKEHNMQVCQDLLG